MSNFWQRLIFGLVYVALLLGCVLWCKYSFLALFAFFTGGMIYEFLRITMGNRYQVAQALTIVAGVLFFVLAWGVRSFPEIIPAKACFLAFIPVLFVMSTSLYAKDKTDFGEFANVYTSLLYVAIPMAAMNFIVMDKSGNFNGLILIFFFILIWASDVGAYVFGMSLGQKFGKKLCPSISPKKSWIGFWGGMFCCVLVSVVVSLTGVYTYAGLESFEWYHALALAVVMNIAGVYGDLFESQWKRHYAVKDSGKIIPGHGGLMDRLDSTIFAVPVGIIYLTIFNLI